jgi:hypothetical protein
VDPRAVSAYVCLQGACSMAPVKLTHRCVRDVDEMLFYDPSGERKGNSLNRLRASLLALRNWGRGIFQGEQQLSRRVTKAQSSRTVKGINKQLVGEIAANIRKQRPPEPYKGKGIRYQGEYVARKVGKRA